MVALHGGSFLPGGTQRTTAERETSPAGSHAIDGALHLTLTVPNFLLQRCAPLGSNSASAMSFKPTADRGPPPKSMLPRNSPATATLPAGSVATEMPFWNWLSPVRLLQRQ